MKRMEKGGLGRRHVGVALHCVPMSVDLSVGLSVGIALLVWSVRCRRSFGSVLVCRSSSLSSVFWLGPLSRRPLWSSGTCVQGIDPGGITPLYRMERWYAVSVYRAHGVKAAAALCCG